MQLDLVLFLDRGKSAALCVVRVFTGRLCRYAAWKGCIATTRSHAGTPLPAARFIDTFVA
jgi:hypothetical protein